MTLTVEFSKDTLSAISPFKSQQPEESQKLQKPSLKLPTLA
jgi:hypothetical protein